MGKVMHGHTVRSVFCFPFLFLLFLSFYRMIGEGGGRGGGGGGGGCGDTYVCFSQHIMRVRF